MGRIKRSRELFKRTLSVIRKNKKLLLFPIVTFFLSLVIYAFFITPVALWNTGYSYSDVHHWKALGERWLIIDGESKNSDVRPVGYILIIGLYMGSMFLATFFNVAFYNEILNALNGNRVSITRGFKFAFSRIIPILIWSLFTGIIGWFIKLLEEKFGVIGRWVMRFIGITWSIASVFAVPVIIREQKSLNPLKYLRTSGCLLKKTWGESLAGFVGIRFIGGLSILISILIGFPISFVTLTIGAVLLDTNKMMGILLLAGGTFVLFFSLFFVNYILSVANHIYRCALYIYAVEGVIPEPFTQEQMETAWKVKSGRKAKS